MRVIQKISDRIPIAQIEVHTRSQFTIIGLIWWPFWKIKELIKGVKTPKFDLQIYYCLSTQSILTMMDEKEINKGFESLDEASDYAKTVYRICKDTYPLLIDPYEYEVKVSFWSLKSNDNSRYENIKAILKKYNNSTKQQPNQEMIEKQKAIQTVNIQEEYNKVTL